MSNLEDLKEWDSISLLQEYGRSVSMATKEANTFPPVMKLIWNGVMDRIYEELVKRLDPNLHQESCKMRFNHEH